jgi:hypothetical protein
VPLSIRCLLCLAASKPGGDPCGAVSGSAYFTTGADSPVNIACHSFIVYRAARALVRMLKVVFVSVTLACIAAQLVTAITAIVTTDYSISTS